MILKRIIQYIPSYYRKQSQEAAIRRNSLERIYIYIRITRWYFRSNISFTRNFSNDYRHYLLDNRTISLLSVSSAISLLRHIDSSIHIIIYPAWCSYKIQTMEIYNNKELNFSLFICIFSYFFQIKETDDNTSWSSNLAASLPLSDQLQST